MRRLIYDAAPHHILVDAGREIHGGEEFTVSDERADELLTQPHLEVTEAPVLEDLGALTRPELNELAHDAGVEAPEKLANKDAVIAAITEAPEADGEGHTDPDKEG